MLPSNMHSLITDLHNYLITNRFITLMSSSLILSPVLTVWEQKSLNRGVCLLFAGPDCSEVIGRENCGRICKQGSCVQASPVSFKCLCRSGGGRQHACVRLLVCPRKALLLSPDRNMKPLPISVCTAASFAWQGQRSLEKVKAGNSKSHISF